MPVAMKNAYFDQVPAADTLLYTVPANTTARVLKAAVTNDTTTVATLTLHQGTAVDDTLLANALPIGNKETYPLSNELEGVILDAGTTLRGEASIATQLTLRIDVVEIV
jgi:hypothetical protein